MPEIIVKICSSVCHALPERTFSFGGQPLPLCARCIGVYLGFALAMIWFTCTRLRSSRLVPKPLLWLNIFVICLFAIAGFAGLYGVLLLPRYLRLLLGMFFGAALAVFAFPLTRQWFLGMSAREWQEQDTRRFFALMMVLLAVSLAVRQGFAFVFWPVVTLAVIGLVGSHFLADLLILNWVLKPRRPWSAGLGFGFAALAALMCVGEFLLYSTWRHWWEAM